MSDVEWLFENYPLWFERFNGGSHVFVARGSVQPAAFPTGGDLMSDERVLLDALVVDILARDHSAVLEVRKVPGMGTVEYRHRRMFEPLHGDWCDSRVKVLKELKDLSIEEHHAAV